MVEEWRQIVGTDGYEVSNLGRVRNKHGRILKDTNGKDKGYCSISLWFGNVHRKPYVHSLVATAFIPNPHGYKVVNHKDRNRSNNRVDNLEWTNLAQNNRYSLAKKVAQIDKDGNVVKVWDCQSDVSAAGFNQSCVSACCVGRVKTHAGFRWRSVS